MTILELRKALEDLDDDMVIYFLGTEGEQLGLKEFWVGAHQRRGFFFELRARRAEQEAAGG